MHNLIVVLFYLAESMVQASAEYLKGIEDPYYRLMEYCLRYSLYRNFVLCIQVYIIINFRYLQSDVGKVYFYFLIIFQPLLRLHK